MKGQPVEVAEGVSCIHAALEHEGRAWYQMMNALGYEDDADLHPQGDVAARYRVGTAEYHYAALRFYPMRAIEKFHAAGVVVDGQLCPYQDCSWSCGFDDQGWYLCPNCKRPFWATSTDSDFEDWHTFQPESDRSPERPDGTPVWAQDLGASWGTPEGNPARAAWAEPHQFLILKCEKCGRYVAGNWYIRHVKSGCQVG